MFLDSESIISKEDEKKRYLAHNNDNGHPGHQAFVSPLINKVTEMFDPTSRGLDFGAGEGVIITKLLKDKGLNIVSYDPFFFDRPDLLKQKYDYVVCCEVIEHFYGPAKEFELLKSLLKPGSALFCMTEIFSDKTDFPNWHYKNDLTHRFFYHKKALELIKEKFNFSSLEINGRVISYIL